MRVQYDPNKDDTEPTTRPVAHDFSDLALSGALILMTHAGDSEAIVSHVWKHGIAWHSMNKSTDPKTFPIVLMVQVADTPDKIVNQEAAYSLEIPRAHRVIFDTADLTLTIGDERFALSNDETSFNLMRAKILPILKANLDYYMVFLVREFNSYPE